MYSMTGYGRGTASLEGRELTIELKSVNNRFLDIGMKLPRQLSFLEDGLRKLLNDNLSRGHVDVFVNYRNLRSDSKTVRVDEALLRAYLASARESAKALDLVDDLTLSKALPLPDGRFLLVGGTIKDAYDARSTVLMCYTQPRKAVAGWLWILIVALGALMIGGAAWFMRRKKPVEESPKAVRTITPDLQTRIVALMEKEQLFRKKDLHISDLATRLNTNSTYVSACLSGQFKMSFPRFVNGYRIRYAQERMLQEPSKPLSEIYEEAGFSNENSFFRAFKAETGQTPTEWRTR